MIIWYLLHVTCFGSVLIYVDWIIRTCRLASINIIILHLLRVIEIPKYGTRNIFILSLLFYIKKIKILKFFCVILFLLVIIRMLSYT